MDEVEMLRVIHLLAMLTEGVTLRLEMMVPEEVQEGIPRKHTPPDSLPLEHLYPSLQVTRA
jgi:hypothetical protein